MSNSAETPSSPLNGTVTLPIETNSPPEGDNNSPPAPPLSDFPSDAVDPNNGTAIAPSNDVVTPPPALSPPTISSSPPPSSPLPSSPPPSSPPPSPPLSSNDSPPSKSEPPSSSPTPPSFSPPPTSSDSPPLSPPRSQHSPPPSTNRTVASPPPPIEGFVSPPPLDSQQSPSPPIEQPNTPPSPVVSNAPPDSSTLNPPPSTETTPTQSGSLSPPVSTRSPSDSSSTSATKTSTGSSSPTTGTGTSGSGSGTTITTRAVAGTVVAGVLLITIIALFFVVRRRKKRRDIYGGNYMPPPTNFTVKTEGYYYGQQPQSMGFSGQANYSYGSQPSNRGESFGGPDSGVLGGNKSCFSYDELMEITNGFSRQNIIGEGGFGCVFKGKVSDGTEVAVKQLKAGSGQGDREFKAEVEIISRVHHRHLVSLVGYSISENQRLLIYEFVPNNTLEHHLHTKGLSVLDWPKRLKIAIGSAKGLAYLHEDCHPKIIHRDIKSANILLDDDFEAQVADFGLARLNDTTQTHVSTRVMGTFGYLAPEYASSGKLTDRSDVYSFGVVLLELITGRKPVDTTQPLGDESLVEWARPLLIKAIETGNLSEIVDPRLEKRYVESEMLRMVEIAAACVRHSAPKRPRMVQVVRALDSDGEMADLSNGVKYGQSTVYDSGQYNQDIMKFRRMALGSGDSSDFSAYSGEYTSRNISNGPLTSGDYQSSESETRAMNRPSPEPKYSGNQRNYGGFM